MALKHTDSYLEDSLSIFRYYKGLAERAMEQVTDEQLTAVLDPEMNSIAQIAKDANLTRTITIRGEPHSVMQAVNRQVAHYSYHCGQIVFLAKHLKSADWKSLSVPRNQSGAFNKAVLAGEKSQR
jgi:uncharacterized protein DUF1572